MNLLLYALLLCSTPIQAQSVSISTPMQVSESLGVIEYQKWMGLVSFVIKQGRQSVVSREGQMLAFHYTLSPSDYPPTLSRLMVIGQVQQSTFVVVGVGFSKEVWSRTGERAKAWVVDRWVFTTSPGGKLREAQHDLVFLDLNRRILSQQSLSARSTEKITEGDLQVFQLEVETWVRDTQKLQDQNGP